MTDKQQTTRRGCATCAHVTVLNSASVGEPWDEAWCNEHACDVYSTSGGECDEWECSDNAE